MSEQTFEEIVKNFHSIGVAQASERVKEAEKFILFIGRSTCPYCRRFAPKLAQVASDHQLDVFFLQGDSITDQEAIMTFRNRHNAVTVPALLVAQKGAVRVICDSSLSPDEILAFIN